MSDDIYLTFSQAWRAEIAATRMHGEVSKPRGLDTHERRFIQFEVQDPLTFPVRAKGRDFKDVIGVLEALSLVGQISIPEVITDRIRNFIPFTNSGLFHGAYGHRISGMLKPLCDLLVDDPDTRQAVLSIYDSPRDLFRPGIKDVPCTLSLQFMRRRQANWDDGDVLDLRVTMRSNDLWLGMPYDFAQFAILQASIAQAIGLRPGKYVHSVGSEHIYDTDLARVDDLEQSTPWGAMAFPLWDPDVGGDTDPIAAISSRARRFLLGQVPTSVTEFEHWVAELLK